MKRIFVLIAIVLLLSGCGVQKDLPIKNNNGLPEQVSSTVSSPTKETEIKSPVAESEESGTDEEISVDLPGYEQIQVFIEPKGTHLIENDKWKEDFLLELESKAIPIVRFADDNKYKIWGFHFFNQDVREIETAEDFKKF